MRQSCRIQLQPDGVDLDFAYGQTLLLGLADHGIFLRSDCGGTGRCKKCQVAIGRNEGGADMVNACQLRVDRNLTVDIPASSRYPAYIVDKAPLFLPETFRRRMQRSGSPSGHGVGIDLGTTTIGLYLCRLGNAEISASLAVRNPQAFYGDDVMNRISAVAAAGGRTEELQRPVLALIDQAIHRLCTTAGIDTASVSEIVVAGNPTMIHILLGENPEPIGVSPYCPAFTEARQTSTDALGLRSCLCRLRTLPLVSGFIGADTLAAVLAIDIAARPAGTLLVDLGTNGELVLTGQDGMFATSCATGPAFEGATLSCGMQAAAGAIDRVAIDRRDAPPRLRLIGDQADRSDIKPVGLCGSGVVSLLAAMLRTGIIEKSGAFLHSGEILGLTRDESGSHCYQIVPAHRSGTGRPITLTQKDIRAVQLGKAALRAGIDYLLGTAGIKEPSRILIAGAFGSHIDAGDMIALGMLPHIGQDRIENVGNAAGGGTVMALCEPASFQKSMELASSLAIVELAANADFQQRFIDRLKFPAPDSTRPEKSDS
ncbi:MAG: DUF4445 domain-containing protein [Desulfobulbaceae bacterium]|nr:MAG: DUF4445 domain-containing protein [Desulfobulbaceae bacterium]